MRMSIVRPGSRLGAWRAAASRAVELWETPCIVSSPPGPDDDLCLGLINPANERMQGTLFTPSECHRNLKGLTPIIYPPQAVDGLVHELGGAALAEALMDLPIREESKNIRCSTGASVLTLAFGELLESYSHIIHTCAPFFYEKGEKCSLDMHEEWRRLMLSCYHSAFRIAEESGLSVVATPLLGAGARGAPVPAAAEVAAAAVAEWQHDGPTSLRLVRFAVQETSIAESCIGAFDGRLERSTIP